MSVAIIHRQKTSRIALALIPSVLFVLSLAGYFTELSDQDTICGDDRVVRKTVYLTRVHGESLDR